MFIAIGRTILCFINFAFDLAGMICRSWLDGVAALRAGIRPVREVFLKQIYFTGLQASSIILAVAALIGIVIITQVMSFGDAGSGSLAGKVLVWVVIREIAPLLTAIIVIARSGTAIAAELGQMKLAGEISVLESLGIPPSQYLVMPRIAGVTASVIILSTYFALASLAGGGILVCTAWQIPLEQIAQGFTAAMTLSDLVQLFTKGACFGIFISAICCRQGLRVGQSATQIPQAATAAVIQSFFAVFILDGVLTFLFS